MEKNLQTIQTDVLVVGSGCAGLYCALSLPRELAVTVITKRTVDKSDSFLAQGGMCTLRDPLDFDCFFEDTMRAGHNENNEEAVRMMIRYSPKVTQDLLAFGVRFARNPDGSLAYTKEGAHTHPRILFYQDITGREIMENLWRRAEERDNITILEQRKMTDLIMEDNRCLGAEIMRKDEPSPGEKDDSIPGGAGAPKEFRILARHTVLATGGIGGVYRHSTNFRNLTGDGIAAAMKHGVEVEHLDYVQIHPTTFYTEAMEDKNFLISESVRGEGAILIDKNGERFADELLPRDKLTAAIREQMKKDDMPYVRLDLSPIPRNELTSHFPHIIEYCENMGYHVPDDPIPVVPAQHYFMGGIRADHKGRTSAAALYAVGETACNGVHGKNRLASNSLLESMVFAGRAAEDIAIHEARDRR